MSRPDARSRLLDEAVDVLAGNDTGRFIKPGPRQYPGQWNWDAAFNVIGLSHVDPARARREVQSLLSGQWTDGMVPHIVFHQPDIDYFPGPAVWGKAPGMPPVPTSGITQPPLLATAVSRLHAVAPNRAFLQEVVGPIEHWHRWFHRGRLTRGLVRILHPWESGMDNSPRWDHALSMVEAVPAPLVRRDHVHVPAEQRPTDTEYGAYLAILYGLRDAGYRPLHGEAPFQLGDVFLTAILSQAELDLAWLWSSLGESPNSCLQRRDTLEEGVDSAWNDELGLFVDDGGPGVATIGGLLPAYGHPGHRSNRNLAAGIDDPDTFGAQPAGVSYPTSVARNAPYFEARRYWRGPVWVNINWLTVETLEAAGRLEAAERVRASTLQLVAEHGFWEYYDPTSGEGLGSDRFSWTAALAIDLLIRS
jgi:hypothetical protein